MQWPKKLSIVIVQVHHPLQQGLRLLLHQHQSHSAVSTSASSITTRIKTDRNPRQSHLRKVQVHHPLQQGLRPSGHHI